MFSCDRRYREGMPVSSWQSFMNPPVVLKDTRVFCPYYIGEQDNVGSGDSSSAQDG